MLHQQPEAAVTVDDITVFLPGISDEEYDLRKRLRSARNVAAMALSTVPDGGTRALFHAINEAATAWIYRSASIAELTDAVELCQHLWRATQVAERLEGLNG